MPGTKVGGLKTRKTVISKYGKDYYRNLGRLGGSVKSPNKGFGVDKRTWFEKLIGKPKHAQVAGQLGGRRSKRRPANA